MVDDIESVYGVKPVLERLGSLQDLSLRVNSAGSSQDTIAYVPTDYEFRNRDKKVNLLTGIVRQCTTR